MPIRPGCSGPPRTASGAVLRPKATIRRLPAKRNGGAIWSRRRHPGSSRTRYFEPDQTEKLTRESGRRKARSARRKATS